MEQQFRWRFILSNSCYQVNWKGFCFDVLHALRAHVNFSYHVASEKNAWGYKTTTGEWKGMIGEIVKNRSDLGVQYFTDLNERREVNLSSSKL